MTTKTKPLPTQERLQELFDYSIVEGQFYWKKSGSGRKTGVPAGCQSKSTGYHQIGIDGKLYQAHRLAWVYINGEDPGALHVDHINGDTTNNAFHNLQLLNNKQNVTKQLKLQGGSSKYRGVTWNKVKRKWQARVQADGKEKHLGYYDSEKDAATVSFLYSRRVYHKQFSTYQMP